jgi:hypothetical protein
LNGIELAAEEDFEINKLTFTFSWVGKKVGIS